MANLNNSSIDNANIPLQTKREVDKGGGINTLKCFGSHHCKTKTEAKHINKNYFSDIHIEKCFDKNILLCTNQKLLKKNSETKSNDNERRKCAKNTENYAFVPIIKSIDSFSSSRSQFSNGMSQFSNGVSQFSNGMSQFSKGMLRMVFLVAVFCTIISSATARWHYSSSNRNGLWDAHQKECPMAFHEIGGRCYFYGYFPLNWFRAAEFCHSFGKGVSLASIETAQENYHIKQWLLVNGNENTGVWIGGSDNGHEGRWAWFPTGQLMDYSNWGPSQPSGDDQHCMYMVGGILGYQWADFHCDFGMNFLCEHGVNDSQPW